MRSNSQSPWLKKAIKDLPFTEHFKAMAIEHNFHTVGDIIQIEVAQLLKLPGFSYHCLQELVEFLEERKLARLLKHS